MKTLRLTHCRKLLPMGQIQLSQRQAQLPKLPQRDLYTTTEYGPVAGKPGSLYEAGAVTARILGSFFPGFL